MNVGHARRCLTPQTDEVYLIGYRNLENRLHPATGIYDDVFGNALYFEDEGKELFVLSCDFMEIDEDTAEDAKMFGTQKSQYASQMILPEMMEAADVKDNRARFF